MGKMHVTFFFLFRLSSRCKKEEKLDLKWKEEPSDASISVHFRGRVESG